MHALREHDHLATACHGTAAHGVTAAPHPDAGSLDDRWGLEAVLRLRVGCWRPPVHVPYWALRS